ncbi:hypothetical protein BJY04DRAFT_222515 [Aspergillus karnatakaensis]|uniref:uncharacterized protein n=1 Tax=Aspergillus karnatakaensis TaxID=1810916 RepID=UPI003CCD2E8F
MELEVVDPEGDLYMVCAGIEFLVSAKVISLVSPVLREMLKGQPMTEAPVKTEYRAQPVLNLPNDNPEALRIFCAVAHHQVDPSMPTPSVECLHHLAHLVVRYKCSSLLGDRSRQWLAQNLTSLTGRDLWKVLEFAYSTNHMKRFTYITRELVWRSIRDSFRFWDFATDNLDVLPRAILVKQGKRRIQKIIMELPDKASEFECKRANAFIADYLRALKEVGLLPGSETLMDKSPAEILRDARNLQPATYLSHDGCDCSELAGHKQRAYLVSQLRKCHSNIGLHLGPLKEEHAAEGYSGV